MKTKKLAQKTNTEAQAPDSHVFGVEDRGRWAELGIQEIELLELYWEDFCEQEWQGHEGRSNRKPNLDDYDRWSH